MSLTCAYCGGHMPSLQSQVCPNRTGGEPCSAHKLMPGTVSLAQFVADRMRDAAVGVDPAQSGADYSYAAIRVNDLPVVCQCPQCGLHISLIAGDQLLEQLQRLRTAIAAPGA